MKKLALLTLAACLFATVAAAQTVATPTQHLGFDEATQPVAVTAGANFNVYIDNAPTGIPATGLVCTLLNVNGSTCRSDIPAMTPGLHVITMTEVLSGNESAKSDPLSIQFVVLMTPTGLRIVSIADLLGARVIG